MTARGDDRRGGDERLPPVEEIPGRTFCHVQSYDGLHEAYCEMFAPRTVDEIRAIFAMARRRRRRITFRAGAQSFDGQALNDDIVISLAGFDSIEVDPARARVTVGAGATWGAIVRALEPHGLVPYVVVSTSYATAGGTVSGDCLSRFSGAGGKEGRYVERLEVLTIDGRLRLLLPRGETAELFHAVIGGLGYFGAVLSITYRVARVVPAGAPIHVLTHATPHDHFKGLLEHLVPEVEKTCTEPGYEVPEAVYSIAYRTLTDTRGIVMRSRYVDGSAYPLRRFLTHRPRHFLRVPIEWLMRFTVLSPELWTIIDRWFFDFDRPYVDDLHGYTFFMDGNVLSKKMGQLWGVPLSTVQQTFIMPFDWQKRRQSLDRLITFLTEIDRTTVDDGTAPTLFDILYVQRDDFLLSANYAMDGFAVTIAFETSNAESVQRIADRLRRFSERARALRGRVHLVKNVHASPATLEAMYAHALPELVRTKHLVDPDGLLQNEFLERVFPSFFPDRAPEHA